MTRSIYSDCYRNICVEYKYTNVFTKLFGLVETSLYLLAFTTYFVYADIASHLPLHGIEAGITNVGFFFYVFMGLLVLHLSTYSISSENL